MSSNSIRRTLVRRLLLVLVAMAVATNAALYVYLRGELIEQYDDALETEAHALAAAWQQDDDDDPPAQIAQTFRRLHFGRVGGDFLEIVGGDGSTLLTVPLATNAGDALARVALQPPALGRRRYHDLLLPNGHRGRAIEIGIERREPDEDVAKPAAPDAPPAPFGLVLAEDRREMDGTLATMAIGLFAIGGGLSAASIWLVVTVVRRGLRPLGAFSESVGRLDADSLAFRFPLDELPDELRPISSRLNGLLARLDEAFARERRFSENVAHELRTPLAELRSMIEVAIKWPPEPDAFGPHHAALLDVVQRMTSVVQTLLKLIRSDAARPVADLAPIDLVACARLAWSRHEQAAARGNVAVTFDAPARLVAAADGIILSSMLDNLFCNAATYATPGSSITCAIRPADGDRGPRLSITNAVVDLCDADLARFEEPFWRKDAARSSGEHSGLGLSLVREYARAMHVGCRYAMPDARRVTVELTWPPRRDPRDPPAGPGASPAGSR